MLDRKIISEYTKHLDQIEIKFKEEKANLEEGIHKIESEKDLYKKVQNLNSFIGVPNDIFENKINELNLKGIEVKNYALVKELENDITHYIENTKSELTQEKYSLSGNISFDGNGKGIFYDITLNLNTKDLELIIDSTKISQAFNFAHIHTRLEREFEKISKLKEDTKSNFIKELETLESLNELEILEVETEDEIKSRLNEINEKIDGNIKDMKEDIKNVNKYLNECELISLDVYNTLFNFANRNKILFSSNFSIPVPENQLRFLDFPPFFI